MFSKKRNVSVVNKFQTLSSASDGRLNIPLNDDSYSYCIVLQYILHYSIRKTRVNDEGRYLTGKGYAMVPNRLAI